MPTSQFQFRALQFNVWEDGLSDAPSSMQLSTADNTSFSLLLSTLSAPNPSNPSHFHTYSGGTKNERFPLPKDVPPSITTLSSASTFFQSISLMYDGFYHPLGGLLYYGTSTHDPYTSPTLPTQPLQNALRTLFLHATLTDPSLPPSASNPWIIPMFAANLDAASLSPSLASTIRAIAETAFCPTTGALTLSQATLECLWKKGDNVYRNKWLRNVEPFLASCESAECEAARSLFITTATTSASTPPKTLMEYTPPSSTTPAASFRTTTFASACHLLLTRLLTHAGSNPVALQAIAEFTKQPVDTLPPATDVPALTGLIFPHVLDYLKSWQCVSALPRRRTGVMSILERTNPGIVTLVEYDEQWRKVGVAVEGGNYRGVRRGEGMTTQILYDATKFKELPSHTLGDMVEIDKHAPKSSTCAMLAPTATDQTDVQIFVVAVHLESGDPSNGKAVRRRAVAMGNIRTRVEEVVRKWKQNATRGVVVVGGDFNSVREEFVHGNADEFFACEGVERIRPRKPRPQESEVFKPEVPYAKIDPEGRLCIQCEGIDAGWLTEGSFVSDGESFTTMSKHLNYVLDYLLVGGVGMSVESKAVRILSPQQCESAGDEMMGLKWSAKEVGSDHLPVASDVKIAR